MGWLFSTDNLLDSPYGVIHWDANFFQTPAIHDRIQRRVHQVQCKHELPYQLPARVQANTFDCDFKRNVWNIAYEKDAVDQKRRCGRLPVNRGTIFSAFRGLGGIPILLLSYSCLKLKLGLYLCLVAAEDFVNFVIGGRRYQHDHSTSRKSKERIEQPVVHQPSDPRRSTWEPDDADYQKNSLGSDEFPITEVEAEGDVLVYTYSSCSEQRSHGREACENYECHWTAAEACRTVRVLDLEN